MSRYVLTAARRRRRTMGVARAAPTNQRGDGFVLSVFNQSTRDFAHISTDSFHRSFTVADSYLFSAAAAAGQT